RFVTADVSFISLKLALAAALDLAAPGTRLIALVKPQFEVGPAGLHKSWIVRDDFLRTKGFSDIVALVADQGWGGKVILLWSIEGGDGNKEFLIAAEKPC